MEGLAAAVTQGRLALEVSRASGAWMPYLRLGARFDGGDGIAGSGAEVVGGLRYAGGRVDFEAQARWLAAHSGEGYKEYGGMARLTLSSRADGSGLRLSLAPTWGAAGGGNLLGGGNGLLGGPNAGEMLPTGGSAIPTGAAGMQGLGALSLEGDLGYGFLLDRGLLTLGANHNRDAWNRRETFGLTWESAQRESPDAGLAPRAGGGLKLLLGYERASAAEQGGPRFELTWSGRF